MTEDVHSRFSRLWLRKRDDRKARGFDQRADERKDREFVDSDDVAAHELVPGLVTAPEITPTDVSMGDTLTTTNGTWTNSPTLSRKWLRDGVVIAGQTGTNYTTVGADVGTRISVEVTAKKSGYPDQKALTSNSVEVGENYN